MFLHCIVCLLYTSDAADEEDSVDLGGRLIIKKKKYDTCLLKTSDDADEQYIVPRSTNR